MRLSAVLLLAALACGSSATAPAYGQKITVKLASAVRMPSDTTTVRFTDVTADSRCPAGAQCVWEGDAAVLFTVGGTQQVTLHTSPAGGPTNVLVAGRLLTLVSVSPYPKLGQTIAKGDYVASIRFDLPKD